MAVYETLSFEIDHGVATITLNRPQTINAINARMRVELLDAIENAVRDDSVRVAILTGAGRAFCAGADLTDRPDGSVTTVIETEYKPSLMAIHDAPKPFIAAVNGAAAGIGSAFAMVCDLMVMADDAYIYQAFQAIGLIPDGGASWQLVRQLGPKRAYELITGGEKLRAGRCLELGLANRVVPAADLLPETMKWARTLAEKAPLALRYAKEALHQAMQLSLAETISHEARLQAITIASEDSREGTLAFFEKRPPHFVGR